ncbi:sporulation histidine kinase inhibitor Sda [Ectobacillus funiculus]
MIQALSNQVLINSYINAVMLKLDSHFISLLRKEIRKRELVLHF